DTISHEPQVRRETGIQRGRMGDLGTDTVDPRAPQVVDHDASPASDVEYSPGRDRQRPADSSLDHSVARTVPEVPLHAIRVVAGVLGCCEAASMPGRGTRV